MATNGNPEPLRRGAVRSRRSGARVIAETGTNKRHGHNIVMLLSLLATAFVLVMATISCVPIPCPGGYPDPNWCQHRGGGGGGGESGGGH
jgi:hypothetical protein